MAKCRNCGVRIFYSEGQHHWFHMNKGHVHLHCQPNVAEPRKKDRKKLRSGE